MAIAGMDESKRKEIETDSRLEMERLSKLLGDLIISQPPKDLLGYIWGKLLIRALHLQSAEPKSAKPEDAASEHISLELVQFVLEYVHATLVSYQPIESTKLHEPTCVEILDLAEKLRITTLHYCMFSSAGAEAGIFGPLTGEIEFTAKTNWVMIRGHRYQVLEQEFFEFVLAPHDVALRETYGVGASEIARGFQAIADSMREGHSRALLTIDTQMKEAQAYGKERGLSFEEGIKAWRAARSETMPKAFVAFNDL